MIKEKINSDLKIAMKEKDAQKMSVLRSIKTAISAKETTKGNSKELDDSGVLSVIESLVKQRKQSIEMFEKGGRQDLVLSETKELNILESFLPKKLSEEDTVEVIKEIIQSGANNIGHVMKEIKAKYPNIIDARLASKLVKELI